MKGLHPIKMPSAREKVASELRKAILSRKLKEGEALSLDSIASQLDVSIMPVREAFQILARDGLIQLRQNKGAVVLGITEQYIRDHYQLRGILESAAAQIICETGASIEAIGQSYENSREAIAEGDFSDYAYLNREFHNEIWETAGNEKMKNLIAELWNGLSMGANMITEEEYARQSIVEHERIMEALKSGDGQAAYDEMWKHILRSRDDMLTYYS